MPGDRSEVPGPRWRVRQPDARRWRGWLNRKLAQADVTEPDGSRYLVRISRNLPFRGSPLGPFDDLLPPHLSLTVLVAANLYARGRSGWSIQIIQPETAWRAERVIFTEMVRGGAAVADTAIALANSVHQGARPWEEPRDAWFRVKQYMNWG